MRNSIRLLFLLMLLVGVLFTSCQQEELEIIEEPQENALTDESSLTLLLLRLAMNDGDIDDFIILGDCFTIAFPFTIIVNGIEIVIENEDDYQLIINILEETGGTIEDIEIVFPIIVILADYTQIVINNKAELKILIAQCVNGQPYNEIDCIDFVYPITFFVYNSDTDITETVIINNDIELFLFLSNLGDNYFFTIQYPISVILEDGTVILIENNEQLENIINECVENDNDTAPLVEYLTTATWYVAYFFDGDDLTSNYCEFEFVFLTEGTVLAYNGIDYYVGSWAVGVDGDNHYLELDFGDDIPFNELNDNWDVLNASMEVIELEDVSGGNTGSDYLTFDREPTVCDIPSTDLVEILLDGQWIVALYLNNGVNNTELFNDFVFNFNTYNNVIVSNGIETFYGTWVVDGSPGSLNLILDFGTAIPFNELNEDWDVIDILINRIELENISGGSGGLDTLVFEKL